MLPEDIIDLTALPPAMIAPRSASPVSQDQQDTRYDNRPTSTEPPPQSPGQLSADSAGEGPSNPPPLQPEPPLASPHVVSSSTSHISIPRSSTDQPSSTIEEEEQGCFPMGYCGPKSCLFPTSIMCDNTMVRDVLANERTYLSWLVTTASLSLVSITFVDHSVTLDQILMKLTPPSGDVKKHTEQRDIHRYLGYFCFAVAIVACLYSLFKYLRNIHRIATRYPFARAGRWTFTLGMVIGTLIMVALVLALSTSA